MAFQTFLLFAVYIALIFVPGIFLALRIRESEADAREPEAEPARWASEAVKSV